MHNEQTLEQHRFVALGQLAAGVAHEINTPVQFIGDNSHFVRQAFDDLFELLDAYESAVAEGGLDASRVSALAELREQVEVDYLREEIPSAIDQTIDGVKLVAQIVKAMKTFSHPGGTRTNVDINELVQTTRLVSKSEWKLVAEFELSLGETVPLVNADAADLRQALLNITVNACHAIGDKQEGGSRGKLSITTEGVDDKVRIIIQDDGGGIPDHVLDHMYEPFFTTKDAGKGTGQGLPIAKRAIEDKCGGTLECEVEAGVGTRFVITLPAGA